MERDVPYGLIVIIAAVAFAIGLMIWAIEGTSGARQTAETTPHQTTTTGSTSRQPNATPVPAPTEPGDDHASYSWRGPDKR